jgi:hypothetical protein
MALCSRFNPIATFIPHSVPATPWKIIEASKNPNPNPLHIPPLQPLFHHFFAHNEINQENQTNQLSLKLNLSTPRAFHLFEFLGISRARLRTDLFSFFFPGTLLYCSNLKSQTNPPTPEGRVPTAQTHYACQTDRPNLLHLSSPSSSISNCLATLDRDQSNQRIQAP